jgi:internalin A
MAKKLFRDPVDAFAEAERRIQKAILSREEFLNLGGLGLTEVPESIGQLNQVTDLDLNDNQLTILPKWFAKLRNLRALRLARNQFTIVPHSIFALTTLDNLFFEQNQLAEVPDFLGRLISLTGLRLDTNRLTTVPKSMGQLINLEYLFLNNNRLKALPESLLNLKGLKELYLQGNRGLGLPPEVLGPYFIETHGDTKPAKPADILDYYFRLRVGKSPLNEAKLILLGRGEVGKTCLVNRLVHDKFASTSITRGISITQWPVTTRQGTVRLHTWDFGGQEIQHATHQFFLTERSLYLVVLNGRAGAEDEDAEYWLKFIKTFGASSPTIVVLNKIKVQPFKLNRTGLKDKYPFIRAFIETDCKPKMKNGIPELKTKIESVLATMKHVRAPFPAGWFDIKDRLAKMKKPFISFAEYRKICAELGENDAKAQERLAGFLDDLGIALNFREDQQLREETVLNPHWITEGVYKIITSSLLADRQGELKPGSLKVIFKGKKDYPPRMHGFLIELMRKFELCFPYQDDPSEHRYLVPELLGKEEPALGASFLPVKCLNFRYDYRLMPEGLLPRFITRTHTMSKPTERWRTGVVLRWEGCRALVKADKPERQVIVRVLGAAEKRRRLLAVIRENFDQIHAEMKEFRPTEWVALEGHPDEWISYGELEKLEKNKVPEFPKTIGDDVLSVNVSQLLDKTEVPGARQQDAMRAGERRPLKLFISYAHEDEKWRAKLAPNLGLLQREGLIEIWSDLEMIAGAKWDDEIKRKLEDADLYLFLMSVDLLNSDYVQNTEFPIARKRHDENQARLIPVVVRKCSWARYFGDIQGLPTAGRPVKQWPDKDQACFDVEEGLRRSIEDLHRIRDRK